MSALRNCLDSKIELGAYRFARDGEHLLLASDKVAVFGLAVDRWYRSAPLAKTVPSGDGK